jgi:hypothetical protein
VALGVRVLHQRLEVAKPRATNWRFRPIAGAGPTEIVALKPSFAACDKPKITLAGKELTQMTIQIRKTNAEIVEIS